MNLYQLLTNKKENTLLFDEGILGSDGRLSQDGLKLVVDLMFQGHSIEKVKEMLVDEIKRYKKDNK